MVTDKQNKLIKQLSKDYNSLNYCMNIQGYPTIFTEIAFNKVKNKIQQMCKKVEFAIEFSKYINKI